MEADDRSKGMYKNKYSGLYTRSSLKNFLFNKKNLKLKQVFLFSHLGDALNKLEELQGRIVVYSIVGCPHCMAAKESLRQAHLPFVDVSIDRFPER